MVDFALYSPDAQKLPAGIADALLKRTAANDGWEYKTAAQLGIATRLFQTTFVEQTIDTTTGSAAFVDLLTQAITTTAGSFLLIQVTGSLSNTSLNSNMDFQLTIDGTPARGAGTRSPAANIPTSVGITYRSSGLLAGAHTIRVRWRTSGGTARIRPATTLNEHASLMIQEVAV